MLRLCAYTLLSFIFQISRSFACTAVSEVTLSNYGFPDAGGLTQFSCSGSTLGNSNVPTPLGIGTYLDPYTFAASGSGQNFQKCETVYIPYFKKYFQFRDLCAACESDESTGKLHIDLYLIQSNENIGQTPCEQEFGILGGTTYTVIREPGQSLPFEPGSLFEGGTCYNLPSSGRVFPDDANANSCSGGGSTGDGTSTVDSATTQGTTVNPTETQTRPSPTRTTGETTQVDPTGNPLTTNLPPTSPAGSLIALPTFTDPDAVVPPVPTSTPTTTAATTTRRYGGRPGRWRNRPPYNKKRQMHRGGH
ncbi:MAG: hypothetical protein Q9164_001019 [Protoblastenia rupestris]